MRKIYAILTGIIVASGVSAAQAQINPKLSIEKAKLVSPLEGKAMKNVSDKKKVLSRADESEIPSVAGDYMMCYTYFNPSTGNTSLVSPNNNLIPTENDGEYKFESFLFSDYST